MNKYFEKAVESMMSEPIRSVSCSVQEIIECLEDYPENTKVKKESEIFVNIMDLLGRDYSVGEFIKVLKTLPADAEIIDSSISIDTREIDGDDKIKIIFPNIVCNDPSINLEEIMEKILKSN